MDQKGYHTTARSYALLYLNFSKYLSEDRIQNIFQFLKGYWNEYAHLAPQLFQKYGSFKFIEQLPTHAPAAYALASLLVSEEIQTASVPDQQTLEYWENAKQEHDLLVAQVKQDVANSLLFLHEQYKKSHPDKVADIDSVVNEIKNDTQTLLPPDDPLSEIIAQDLALETVQSIASGTPPPQIVEEISKRLPTPAQPDLSPLTKKITELSASPEAKILAASPPALTTPSPLYAYFVDPNTNQPIDLDQVIPKDLQSVLVAAQITQLDPQKPESLEKQLQTLLLITNPQNPTQPISPSSLTPEEQSLHYLRRAIAAQPDLLRTLTQASAGLKPEHLKQISAMLPPKERRFVAQIIDLQTQLKQEAVGHKSALVRKIYSSYFPSHGYKLAITSQTPSVAVSHLRISTSSGRLNISPRLSQAFITRVAPRLGATGEKIIAAQSAKAAVVQGGQKALTQAGTKIATKVAPKLGAWLATRLGSNAIPVIGQAISISLIAKDILGAAKKILPKGLNPLKDLMSDLGIRFKKLDPKALFGIGLGALVLSPVAGALAGPAAAGVTALAGGTLMATNAAGGAAIVTGGVVAAGTALVAFPGALLAGSGIAIIVATLLIAVLVPAIVTLFIIFTAHSAFLAPLQPGGPIAGPGGLYPVCWPTWGTIEQGPYCGTNPEWSHCTFNSNAYDISNVLGTPVYAAHDGHATANPDTGHDYGNYVQIDSPLGFSTIYAHLASFTFSGTKYVTAGTPIGAIDNTGYSEGNHLHYEIRGNASFPSSPTIGTQITQDEVLNCAATQSQRTAFVISGSLSSSNIVISDAQEIQNPELTCTWSGSHNLAAAINANFFKDYTNYAPVGWAGFNGQTQDYGCGSSCASLTFNGSGIVSSDTISSPPPMAVSGVSLDSTPGTRPRSALGIKGNTIYLAVMSSATPDELKLFMETTLGVTSSIQLDGGGSSSFCQGSTANFPSTRIVPVNIGLKEGEVQTYQY